MLQPVPADSVKGAQAFGKAIAVLNLVADAPRPARFSDLLAASGLPKGTLHRLLAALIEQRLVRLQARDQTYRLGPRLFELAHRVWADFDLRDASAGELQRLSSLWRGTAHLAVPDGAEALIIDLAEAPQPFRLPFGVGRRLPLHATALGKALLAFTLPERRAELLDRTDLQPVTPRTVVERAALERDLDLAVIRGYAIDDEEYETGIRCVAAPVLDHAGVPLAAVSISQPAFRVALDELHVAGRDVIDAARQIGGNAGATPVFSISTPPRPPAGAADGIRPLVQHAGINPESPLWDPATGRLHWVDILEPAAGQAGMAGPAVLRPLADVVSCIALRRKGGLIAATRQGLAALDPATGVLEPLLAVEPDRPRNRPNDGACDRKGRFWIGTMAMDGAAGQGSLWRIEGQAPAVRVDGGFGVSNGIAWSPDDRWLYFVDSRVRTIFRYPFESASGSVGQRQPFLELPTAQGNPAGLAVDREGHLWCTLWDGWGVVRIDPQGRIIGRIDLPVPRPTSCTLGGPGLDTLLVTTARTRLSRERLAEAPLSGAIFQIGIAVPGLPETPFSG